VIIHFRKGAREKWGIDFPICCAYHDPHVEPTKHCVNGGKMGFAIGDHPDADSFGRMIKDKSNTPERLGWRHYFSAFGEADFLRHTSRFHPSVPAASLR